MAGNSAAKLLHGALFLLLLCLFATTRAIDPKGELGHKPQAPWPALCCSKYCQLQAW